MTLPELCGDIPAGVVDAAWTFEGRELRFDDVRTGDGPDAWSQKYWGGRSWTLTSSTPPAVSNRG